MRLSDCHNIEDFRKLARARLPWPVFDYIDGAADDELTKARNTAAFADADLVPDVLAGVAEIDTGCTIMGRRSALPLMLSPTALQRVFHWQGELAVARAADGAFDAGAWMKQITEALGGRGGGKPESAQGAVSATVDQVLSFARDSVR